VFLISHRGNINGINHDKENSPLYIDEALNSGFDVEIDVRCLNKINSSTFLLGHDEGQYEVELDWFRKRNKNLWIHAKNLEALSFFSKQETKYNVFWHQDDEYTLTNKGYIWAYPGSRLDCNSVCVLPEKANYSKKDLQQCAGICSDVITTYNKIKND